MSVPPALMKREMDGKTSKAIQRLILQYLQEKGIKNYRKYTNLLRKWLEWRFHRIFKQFIVCQYGHKRCQKKLEVIDYTILKGFF